MFIEHITQPAEGSKLCSRKLAIKTRLGSNCFFSCSLAGLVDVMGTISVNLMVLSLIYSLRSLSGILSYQLPFILTAVLHVA